MQYLHHIEQEYQTKDDITMVLISFKVLDLFISQAAQLWMKGTVDFHSCSCISVIHKGTFTLELPSCICMHFFPLSLTLAPRRRMKNLQWFIFRIHHIALPVHSSTSLSQRGAGEVSMAKPLCLIQLFLTTVMWTATKGLIAAHTFTGRIRVLCFVTAPL